MIRHIVAFRLNAGDPEKRREDVAGIKARLVPLKSEIPNVLSLDVHSDLGLVESHWHAVLVAEYPDNDALEAYQSDPRHLEAVAWVNTVVSERAVIDYEL